MSEEEHNCPNCGCEIPNAQFAFDWMNECPEAVKLYMGLYVAIDGNLEVVAADDSVEKLKEELKEKGIQEDDVAILAPN